MSTLNWKWYAGSNEEEFHSGPFDTREEAIVALDGYGGFIIEAHKSLLSLAKFFDARDFLDQAEEDAWEHVNENGDLVFDVTNEQAADLETKVREAIVQWQESHNLVFEPWAFSGTRNLERINGEVEDPEQPGPFS